MPVDVAEAVTLLIEAARPQHQLYNISSGAEWSALQWGEELAALHPGFICRLTDAGEVATVDLHSPADRAPLSSRAWPRSSAGARGSAARTRLPI
jgi:UDP-glucose 4-epimerase